MQKSLPQGLLKLFALSSRKSLRHSFLHPCKKLKQNTHYFQPPSCRLFGRFAVHKIMRVLFTFACIHFLTCGSFVNLSKYIFLPVFLQVNRMYVMLQRGLQPRRLLNITSILFRCAAMDGGTPGLRVFILEESFF